MGRTRTSDNEVVNILWATDNYIHFGEGWVQREEVCDEGVGLWGESQLSNDFPKIVDKIPDERRLNRGKPGLN